MKDDLELHEMNDDDLKNLEELERSLKDEFKRHAKGDNSTLSSLGRRTKSDSSKLLPILIGTLIIVVFAGTLFYFVATRSPEGNAQIQSKMPDVEQKIANLEKQVAELHAKIDTAGPKSGLVQQVEALSQKVDALEKRAQPATGSKSKLTPSKTDVATQKQYHTVQKGETLYKIGKKYGIAVEELRKLNNLSGNQSIQTGQKLLISPGQ